VPVWFTDAQRHALLDACKVAGFQCLKLFNETTAVAVSYGIYKADLPAEGEAPRRVIFVDFGHSQLQMSCCEMVKGKLTVLTTACDPFIGGRSFDLAIVDHFAENFKVAYFPLFDPHAIDISSIARAVFACLVAHSCRPSTSWM
jgi:molecular chaperone DnaK (HSP70)